MSQFQLQPMPQPMAHSVSNPHQPAAAAFRASGVPSLKEPVRLLIQGATPGEMRPDYQVLLAALRDAQRLGYRVIDELVHYAAAAPHVIDGQAAPVYPSDLGGMGLPSGHPWLQLPNIFLIELEAASATQVTRDLYRMFNDPTRPELYIEVIEAEPTLGLSLSSKIGTGFNFADPLAMHSTYKSDILWTNTNSAGASVTGSGVTVAVLDSGSTTVFAGWHDFTASKSATPVDAHGHGTAMAAIIHDLAQDADIHVMRVADAGTLGLFDLMAALLTAVVHVKAHIVNMSLGVRSSVLPCASCGAVGANRSTVFDYWFKGLAAGASVAGSDEPIYACAVGNSGAAAAFEWPAAFAEMVAVGSITHAKARSRFSNAGSSKTSNYILCPGGETDPSGAPIEWVGNGTDGTTKTFCTGTSPATAYSSGLFALYRQHLHVSRLPFQAGAVVNEAIKKAKKDVTDPATGLVDPSMLRMVLDI